MQQIFLLVRACKEHKNVIFLLYVLIEREIMYHFPIDMSFYII